ncbi:hypothetical protein KOW79_017715 [Hemibagrus wyckioides]|uniref:Uncharacterized protein n=1 Tax=Hemibagrus wyckioides TaxID=337641 RepID=A0A9D3N9G6_9TELE|nr:hypothetical protein KOW79_017715 [Hemibagrus wyckioides]
MSLSKQSGRSDPAGRTTEGCSGHARALGPICNYRQERERAHSPGAARSVANKHKWRTSYLLKGAVSRVQAASYPGKGTPRAHVWKSGGETLLRVKHPVCELSETGRI